MIESDVSFEFFPPNSEQAESRLWDCLNLLKPANPRFVSVTYGAGGTTRERTLRTVSRIVKDTQLAPAAHVTCVGASKKDIRSVIEQYWQAGVAHIVALRGDSPAGIEREFEPHPEGFQNSIELIEGIRVHRPELGKCFEISVAAYPEPHPESKGWETDMAILKAKQDAGADRAITQFFYDPNDYFRLIDRAQDNGVSMPIVPGIMLQSNIDALTRMASMVGAKIPNWVVESYEGFENDLQGRVDVAAKIAAKLVNELHDKGFKEFHFYTLNRAHTALATCKRLGIIS